MFEFETEPFRTMVNELSKAPLRSVRHKRRGTIYTVLFEGQLQWSEQPQLEDIIMTVYKSESGKIWIRPSSEFNDGRFEEL